MIQILSLFILFLLSSFHCLKAQSFVYMQNEMRLSSYEDLSDFLRRYPGMYPLDYGTLGAPILFRPWNLNPWEFRVDKDGIPQNRIYDGLYDSNLQPAMELDTISYDFLSSGAAGKFSLTTRTLPTDKPYTEFLIREGFYGYGTVDFAHGQKVYKSATIEFTGKLAWYNGFLDSTASRFNRLRGKIGFDLNKKWRTELTYAGSNTDTDFPVNGINLNPYSEREEGIVSFTERDSAKTTFSPSLKFYARQDRERWKSGFKAREEVYGYVFTGHAKFGEQNFSFRQLSDLVKIDFPNINGQTESNIRAEITDSIYSKYGNLQFGVIGHEQFHISYETGLKKTAFLSIISSPINKFSLLGGIEYTESEIPIAWQQGGNYLISNRPLIIDSAFSDISRIYAGGWIYRDYNQYLKSNIGVQWKHENTIAYFSFLTIDPTGDKQVIFAQNGGELKLKFDKSETSKFGLAEALSIPIKYGLSLESGGFIELKSKQLNQAVDSRFFNKLKFQHDFFKSPLTVRSFISHEYYGNRTAYSDKAGVVELPYANVFGFRVSATIKGVTLIWGMENILSEDYEILPGYPRIGKEEYLSINWQLWL